MKILIIAGFADSIITFRGDLIRAMQAQGCEVHVAAPEVASSPRTQGTLAAMGVQLHEIPLARTGTNPFADIRLSWRLFRLMRNLRPDMVLGYTIKPAVYGSIAAWLARVPRRYVLMTGLGYAFTNGRGGLLPLLIRSLYAFAIGRTHKVFFQNGDDQKLFRSLNMLPDRVGSVVINGSGVDTDHYVPVPLPSTTVNFLMIGRLLGDKGVREYVAAAKTVKARYPQVRFRLVGWIDSNPDAISQSELDAWIASGVIEFGGKLDDVRPAIADCTTYVLPSYREGTPRTVLEAMAMGRPIITTDAPGCRETTVDGDNGFLVPVGSEDALVQAMLRFVEVPELATQMGQRSRMIAEEKYDVRKVNAIMLREMGIVAHAQTGIASR
ncbi:MAG TPA: glycosyltransferase family 4 protein [Dokdonella sp.]|uniref:glycosyltransferase family 4 protein n=1 Tax=Dokdonella sp. TaxID=2291710 RepID=UPI002D7FFA3B|nr:glycosyltransferase family 4 protein [Dokdonella sp.]HET9031773.1 glycosyltransferase family 4 protein [Dokdonella sp.]